MSITTLAVGIILVVASVWWIAQGSAIYIGRSAIADLTAVINGLVPVLLFVVGLFVVWLELDELKAGKKSK